MNLFDLLGRDLSWITDEAICAQTDPEAFFPEKGHAVRPGVTTCTHCPLKKPCLQYALDTHAFGIWGGTSEQDRRHMGSRARPERTA